jgi:hypothetical protein
MKTYLKHIIFAGGFIAACLIALLVFVPNNLYKSLTDYAIPIIILLLVCVVWLFFSILLAIISAIKKAFGRDKG